ncbi:hypothetical protein [Kangiella koreensis]|uniref:Uncharacterized protein n=1 Tax=Kangiella koreensis (strain DSM 16069 / JCM 12317 / KCTC 12182 / SW-125) TaxID=523791 RepID=C7R5Y0_KANKD|nr:hypothetical protein [Kangiella koreensis]ACV27304.1 hypothetical protein Kkor_1894 [Kangiella koreensis DSM 16069]
MLIDKSQISRDYPSKLGVDDWYYRLEELTSCHWQLKAASLFGLTLSYEGSDELELIERCKIDAIEYNKKFSYTSKK